jgi:hypothetical protein
MDVFDDDLRIHDVETIDIAWVGLRFPLKLIAFFLHFRSLKLT